MGKGKDRNAPCPKCHKKLKDCSGHWQKWAVLLMACVIALCLVVFFVINSQSNIDITGKPDQRVIFTTDSEEPTDPEKAEQVRLLQREWLEAAQAVVKETNNPTAKEIYEFILENGVLCYPNKQGFRIIEGDMDQERWFAFVPLLDYAKDIPELKDLFSANAAGNFRPAKRTLIIRENPPVSKIWRGFIILHESHHAKTFLTNPFDLSDPRVLCYKEAETHIFESDLMKKIGGERYQQCLQEELERIRKTAVIENGLLEIFPYPSPYDSRLDEVFGASLSEYEVNMRTIHFWIAAMFDFLDENIPEANIYKAKAEFIYTVLLELKLL